MNIQKESNKNDINIHYRLTKEVSTRIYNKKLKDQKVLVNNIVEQCEINNLGNEESTDIKSTHNSSEINTEIK